MSPTSGLKVRQHQRHEIELPIEFVVCEEHRNQVRFSASSGAVDHHTVRGRSIDVSPGGIGIVCRQFIPRMCEGSLRLLNPMPIGTSSNGMPILEVAFEHRVKVRRIWMDGREPTYLVGLAFADPETVDPNIGDRISKLAKRISAETRRSSPRSGEPDD
ncbi:MAG: hypothetical protein IH830_08830 [Planctomycetes bacterium]|nr:hypothetical protein [Planctomycetota bacterium]